MYLPLNQPVDLFLYRIPLSSQNNTYTIIPREFLRGLYGVYGMDLPTQFMKPDLSAVTFTGDTIQSNADTSTIAYLGEFLFAPLAFFVPNPRTTERFPDNGKGVDFRSTWTPGKYGPPDQGWTTIDTLIIRLGTSGTPSGHFPVYLNHSLPFFDGKVWDIVGYDAAVCLIRHEPWIIETYNTSIGSPSALRVVERGSGGSFLPPSGNIRGSPIANTRYLNMTGKDFAFATGYGHTVVQMNSDTLLGYYVDSIVGLTVPLHTTFLLTSTCSTGCFFHQRDRTSGIHGALS